MSDTNTKSFSKKQLVLISVAAGTLFVFALGLLIAPANSAGLTPDATQEQLEIHAAALRYENKTKELEINLNTQLIEVDQAKWQLEEHKKSVKGF